VGALNEPKAEAAPTPPAPRLGWRRTWPIAVALVAVLGVVWVRCLVESHAELDAATHAPDFASRIMHLQQAMRWYAPGAGAPVEAADRLEAAARLAEVQGQPDEALAAWRRLRGGIRSTRHLWSPFGEREAAVDTRIAELMATQQLALGGPSVRGRDRATLVADHRALLALDATPKTGSILLILLGFVAWVASAFTLTRRGFDATLRVQRGPFLRWSMATLASFGLWLVGLWQA